MALFNIAFALLRCASAEPLMELMSSSVVLPSPVASRITLLLFEGVSSRSGGVLPCRAWLLLAAAVLLTASASVFGRVWCTSASLLPPALVLSGGRVNLP